MTGVHPANDGSAALDADKHTGLEEGPMSAPGAFLPSRRRWSGDRIFVGLTGLFGALVLLIPTAMFVALGQTARPALSKFGLGFVTSSVWDPVNGQFGALPFIYGTVASSLLAVLLAVPVSLGVAIYLAEFCPVWLRRTLTTLVELLAAIPSVVYGFWAVAILVPLLRDHVQPVLGQVLGFLPFFRGPPLGFGMMAAGIILAIMILPTISSVCREVLRAVPSSHREAAIGLGATPWETIRFAVLPSARSGIVGAIVLGLGRALGETMAVAMVIGNRPVVETSLFAPGASIASVIANEFAEADSDLHLAALGELALLLFGVALLLNLFAQALVRATGSRSA